jgi:hypothetical protein
VNSRGELLARLFGLRLKALEEIRGFLGVAGGGEDRAGIVFQDGEPALQVSRMILADFRSNSEVAANEAGANFGNELLHCITGVAVFLAAEVSVQARRVAGAMTVMPISA